MKSVSVLFLAILVSAACQGEAPRSGAVAVTPQAPKVRQPAVAGAFYPGDAQVLGKIVDGFLAHAEVEPIAGPLVAITAPHAGYEYSGQVAAHSFALLRGRKFARVVVIAPCHIEAFDFSSIYDGDAYATPLGTIAVDREFARKLAAESPRIKISSRGHGIVQGRGEHALEVELPFLQRVLGEFKLVPIVMGDQTYDLERSLGVALAKLMREARPKDAQVQSDTLIVASSDLSHFHPYDDAVRLDRKLLNALEEWDYFNMSQNFERRVWEACGGGPIVAAMIAAEKLGANRAKVLKYANSGDATGDKSRVVGYGAAAFYTDNSKRANKGRQNSLSEAEEDALMKIAKQSVFFAVKERKMYQCSSGGMAKLDQDRGAFVTLKKHGELRGCIGYIAPTKPLCMTVRDVAAAAALEDPRFRPVEFSELPQLEYEVSVLSPLRRVTDMQQIKVGEHGLVAWKGDREGLLLPQVPVEQHWDRATFLKQTCVKAGLQPNAWKDEGTDIFMFTALVFGEHTRPEPPNLEAPPWPQPGARPGAPGQGLPRQ
ncbi:MAG: AmmeMemoRadiSam system protein B [Acidobacteria bacterium]|nr:AmmeMemoRadiSam system protein B [Acidobacteriota bacterium]